MADISFTGPKHLTHFTLGMTSGVTRVFLPFLVNVFSDAIHIPGGFAFGGNSHSTVYVSLGLFPHLIQCVSDFILCRYLSMGSSHLIVKQNITTHTNLQLPSPLPTW